MRFSRAVFRRRLFLCLVFALCLFLLLLGRLAYLQLFQGEWLMEKAHDLWNREVPFEPMRGKILDRNGVVLAYNVSAPSVLAIPAQIQSPREAARQLGNVLGMDEERLYQLLTKRQLLVRIVPEGRQISPEKAQQVRDLKIPGIVIADDSKRYYPYGTFAAHVLGFTGVDGGLAGVEYKYDHVLQGKKGAISFMADARGREIPGLEEGYRAPQDGYDLVLTLDKSIQSFIERELDQAMLQYEADHALAIAMNPNTGEILGMASRPTYHPGQFSRYPPEVYNRVLPIWMAYEPGSTFKIITLAAALEEKKIDLNDTFYDPGHAIVAGAKIRCWKAGGHGHQTFLEVVENSCNPGFIEIGQRLGKELLFQYIRDFGFGSKTGIDLNGEAAGILFPLEKVGPVELATTSFGQGVSVTPLQQVTAVAAAINGGKLMKPHLAKQIQDPETGEVIQRFEPEVIRRVISPETSQKVRLALESVVARGTGMNAYIDGYRVGGKTGTAQKVGPGGKYLPNNHIVSFIGFAPADNPQILVYVAVDNPKGIQFGGVVAAPIVRNIMEDSLHYLRVEPRKDQIPKEIRFNERPLVEVPDLVGASVKDIQMSQFGFRLETFGEGDRVINQAPKPGVKVQSDATIRIYLGDAER
ncbi:MAG: stage V sporulation protein D [Bacillaceae bacterium G1]|nr:stage V sporulation protein D [Bacillota bacterium]OJF17483.1 MAG: stage V sporulation protein D [Bacillaceae bacterium G1]